MKREKKVLEGKLSFGENEGGFCPPDIFVGDEMLEYVLTPFGKSFRAMDYSADYGRIRITIEWL